MKKPIQALVLAAIPATATALSPDYLAGPWCYSHYQAGDQREDQNINYVFNQDGTLLYQNNPSTPVEKPGTWSPDGDAISIKPTFMMFNFKLKSQTENQFVLDAFGDHVFLRGECQ